MIIYDDLSLRATKDDTVFHAEFDDFKLIFYIVCVVFAGAILALIGCVIGLFAWVQKLSIAQTKNTPRSLGRGLKPFEELTKRYTMSADDNENLHTNLKSDNNPFSRQPSSKRHEPEILGNAKYNNHKSGPGSKNSDKRKEPHTSIPMNGMHFAEDKSRDSFYY